MKNKFLPTICIVLLLNLILVSNVFAFTESFEYDGTTHKLQLYDVRYKAFTSLEEYNDLNYNFLVSSADSLIQVYFIPKEFDLKIWIYDNGKFGTNISDIPNYTSIHYTLKASNGSLISKELNCTDFSEKYYRVDSTTHMFYTNMNVYTDESCTDVFYEGGAFSLGSFFERTNPMLVYKILMKDVIVIILVAVVGILAFRKGWSFLKGQTKKA